MSLSVLTFKWRSDPNAREQFTAQHVNILYAMVKRNLTLPFNFFCITDDFTGIRSEVNLVKLWDEPYIERWNPSHPNCFRRLKIYSQEAKKLFGEKILLLDLDMIILKNINDLVDREQDFVAWNKGGTKYQGAIILHKTGTRSFLWDEFNSDIPKLIKKEKRVGSDQAWVSMRLGPDEAVWTPKDGIYSYKVHIRRKPFPENVKIILCHGKPKPWQINESWIQEHYHE